MIASIDQDHHPVRLIRKRKTRECVATFEFIARVYFAILGDDTKMQVIDEAIVEANDVLMAKAC